MLLSIDQGTTGTSAMLLSRKGRVLGKGYAEFPQHYPKPAWVEHEPSDLLASTHRSIRLALKEAGKKAGAIEGIGITNQRETVLLWDRETGKPLHRAIVWQCRRTSGLCDKLKAAGKTRTLRSKTGLVIDAYFSGTKLQWLLDHVKGARQKAKQGRLAFGTVDTWLIWNLTGGAAHVTDYTNASRTLLYNIRTHRWDPALLELFTVPEKVLPEVRSPDALFGTTRRGGALPAGIPICGVAGDQQAAMVGHACVSKGSAKNTYGTGCFLLQHVGDDFVQSKNGLLTTLAFGGKKPAYALEGSIFIAGAAIQWLRDGMRVIKNAAETEAIARKVKDTEGVYMVPSFVGLGAPHWDMDARAAFVGLTRGTTRETMITATLESLAFQTRDVVEAMQKDSGVKFKELKVDGGAAQNDWLMQFQADILGFPVVRPSMLQNTGKGAALLAGEHLGWWSVKDFAGIRLGRDKRFEPRMKRSERALRYEGWLEALERVKSK